MAAPPLLMARPLREELVFAASRKKGVNKKHLFFVDMSEKRGGGEVNLSVTRIYFFIQEKMHNVLKRKKLYFGRISFYIEFFLSKSYVLDHSESIDMHIEK